MTIIRSQLEKAVEEKEAAITSFGNWEKEVKIVMYGNEIKCLL